MYPVIQVGGSPRQQGVQYGTQARPYILKSIELYRRTFAHYTGWDWDTVRRQVAGFESAISEFNGNYLEMIAGIAEGASVESVDILAINCRTEVMFAAKARSAEGRMPLHGECSAFARIDAGGAVMIGQNWDWLPQTRDTVVVLVCAPDSGPRSVTVVEAGLLGKFGANSAGVGVLTNALVSSLDEGQPGVPYHILLRALLDAPDLTAALAVLEHATRASSANFILAHRSGIAINVESEPGGPRRVYVQIPDRTGTLCHTNHFLSTEIGDRDLSLWVMPDSVVRLQRMERALTTGSSVGDYTQMLSDHAGAPFGICTHPDLTAEPLDQSATVASSVIDLSTGQMLLASGLPCSSVFEEICLDGVANLSST